jgi:hypothetical protein
MDVIDFQFIKIIEFTQGPRRFAAIEYTDIAFIHRILTEDTVKQYGFSAA